MKKEVNYKELAETYESIIDDKNATIKILKINHGLYEDMLSATIEETLKSDEKIAKLYVSLIVAIGAVVILTALNIMRLF